MQIHVQVNQLMLEVVIFQKIHVQLVTLFILKQKTELKKVNAKNLSIQDVEEMQIILKQSKIVKMLVQVFWF